MLIVLGMLASAAIACAQHADQWYFRPPQVPPEEAEWEAVPPYPEEIVRALGLQRPAALDEDARDDMAAAPAGNGGNAGNDAGADDDAGDDAGAEAVDEAIEDAEDSAAGSDEDLRELAGWYPRVEVVSYECRELRGLDVNALIDTFGAPHSRSSPAEVLGDTDDQPIAETWTYTLDPTGQERFPKRDLRLIGRIRGEFPRLRLSFEIEDGTVRRATVPWCLERPAYDYTVRALLGAPDDVSAPDGNQVVWSYYYECLTATTLADGATQYRMRHLRLWLQIDNERHTGGVHLEIRSAMSLRVDPTGGVDNLFVGERWPMRIDGAQQLADIGLKSMTTAEEVEFTFGRPVTVQPSDRRDGKGGERWHYPLTPTTSPPTRAPIMVVRVAGTDASELLVIYPDGIPTDAATLQSMLGAPSRRDGPDLYGHERWSYEYRCRARPPFGFPPARGVLETPIRIVFDVRSGVRVDLLAELVKGKPRLIAEDADE